MPTPKNDKDPKVMDVERPGSSTPSASAKPIIVTNRPILRRDPMMATPDGLDKPVTTTLPGPVSRIAKTVRVVQPTASTPDKTEKPTTSAAKAGAVAPPKLEDLIAAKTADANERVSADKKEATPAPAAGVTPSDADQPAPSETVAATPEVKPEASSTPNEPAEPTSPSAAPAAADEDDDDLDGESSDNQLAPNRALEEAKRKEEEAKAARQAEEEKIITSRQYYLPLSTVEQRRGLDRVLLILALVLLLGLVWADIVIDAGIVHIGGVHALTHFFTK